jgi:hypothetical protein
VSPFSPAWAKAEWSPFGVALEPVYEPVVEFGVAGAVGQIEMGDGPLGDAAGVVGDFLAVALAIEGKHEPACRYSGLPRSQSQDADDCCCAPTPALDSTGAPVIEWAPATREQLGDGDTVRVTQVGRWKGTRLVGKTTHYERKTASA